VHCRDFQRIVHLKIGKQARNALSEHSLADSRWAVEEHVVPTGCGYFTGPLGFNLTHDISQVETTVRVLAGPLADHFDGLNGRHRVVLQQSDQLGDRGNTKDLDPFDQLGLSGLAQRDHYPREAGLLSRQRGGQDAAHGPKATIQPEFTQQNCSA